MSTSVTLTGTSCGGCEANVVEALEGVSGVESATADREAGTATVAGDAAVDALVAAVEDAGYEASA